MQPKKQHRYHHAVEGQYQWLVDSVDDAVVIMLDDQGHVMTWNAGAQAIKGYTREEILGRHFSVFYSPQANAVGHPQSELEIARATGSYQEEGWRVRKDGSVFWASVKLIARFDSDGQLLGFGKFTRDLSERLQAEQQAANTLGLLRTTVRTDALTGLLNRRGLDAALDELLGQGRPFCVAMLDLDQFKTLNDRDGHSAGDQLLRRAANAWRAATRTGDLMARYGGDEFCYIMPGVELNTALLITERIRSATPLNCPCSAGVAAWTPGITRDELLRQADKALYAAKRAGRNTMRPSPTNVIPIEAQTPSGPEPHG